MDKFIPLDQMMNIIRSGDLELYHMINDAGGGGYMSEVEDVMDEYSNDKTQYRQSDRRLDL